MKTPAVWIFLTISAIFHMSVFAGTSSDPSIATATVYPLYDLRGDLQIVNLDRCMSSYNWAWIRNIRSVDVPPGGCVRLCGSHSGTENCRKFRHGNNKNLPSHVTILSICPCRLQSNKRTAAANDLEEHQLSDSPEYPY